MRTISREKAEAYFRERTRYTVIYLSIWAVVSFGVVLFAERFSSFSFNGFPFHYFMGAQGAIVIFILLLFINAVISDRIDRKYGIGENRGNSFNTGTPIE